MSQLAVLRSSMHSHADIDYGICAALRKTAASAAHVTAIDSSQNAPPEAGYHSKSPRPAGTQVGLRERRCVLHALMDERSEHLG